MSNQRAPGVSVKAQSFSLRDTIDITPSAMQHFLGQLKEKGHLGLRIALKESGCSGYKYDIQTISAPVDGDIKVVFDEQLAIYIAPKDALAFRGMQIDYVRQGLNQTVKFSNPNAKDACGCGESFNVDFDPKDESSS